MRTDHQPLPIPLPFTHTHNDPILGEVGYHQRLRRSLGMRHLLAYGLVFMVPIAPFGIFGGVFAASGGMIALAYAIGMIAMLITAISYAQMVKAFPQAGSVYNYCARGINAPIGFLAGWAIVLDYVLVPGLLSLIAAVAMHTSIPNIPVQAWIIGFLTLNTIINMYGIRLTAAVTQAFLLGEILILLLFITIGIWALTHGHGHGFTLDPLYNPDTFTWPIILSAVSVAMLSFLGFDGISMLAEENTGGPRQIGRSMIIALLLAGVLFIAQTWIAALLTPDTQTLIKTADPDGTAFYTAARIAGGTPLAHITATATALAWGIANTLVAQVATSRLLFAMARDRQLPRFLAKVSPRRAVPTNAVLLVAAISATLSLYMAHRSDGIALMSSIVNFGAITAFLLLHLCVISHYLIRQRSRNLLTHLFIPTAGIAILTAVAIHAHVLAQHLGLAWLGLGLVILAGLTLTGRRPHLSAWEN